MPDLREQLTCADVYGWIRDAGVGFFAGVPDSLVGPLSFYLSETASDDHVIMADEGSAVAAAIGYHAASGNLAFVYMQNSGLGNALDPLVSLADPSVFSVPMLLFIGWRGEPDTSDEPQHTKQGAVTTGLLEYLDIPYEILSQDARIARLQIRNVSDTARTQRRPAALLLRKDVLAPYGGPAPMSSPVPLTRERALQIVLEAVPVHAAVVSGIGKVSREVYEFREAAGGQHAQDLRVVGGMGFAGAVALGLARDLSVTETWCLDGDGAVLMHLGTLANIGGHPALRFRHVVFNNGVHDSVGGQPSAAASADLPAVAAACGYQLALTAHNPADVTTAIQRMHSCDGPVFLEIRVRPGARADLGRPKTHPRDNLVEFSRRVRGI